MRIHLMVAVSLVSCGQQTASVGSGVGEEQEVEGAVMGNNSAGENLGGVNLAGANLGANNLAGNNLAGANLGGTNLAAANLAGANLAGTNLGGNNLGGNNLAGANLAGTNLAGTNLAGANLAGSNLATSNLKGSADAGVTPLHGTPIAGTVRLPTTAVTFGASGAGVNIHNRATVNGLLSSGEDLYTRAQACVVMGVGSVAFSRLVTDNGAGPMYGALKKQSWGFADTAGVRTSDAWELVVWGPSRYCVFIIGAPRDATFQGVRGFIKAIFRWNAPPTMSLTVGELGGTTTAEVYQGMMGAAAKYAAGVIDERALVAGELGFASATTNNITVAVDFSAWVRTKTGGKLILANVGPNASGVYPSYIEGAFTVSQRTDGAVNLSLYNVGKGTATGLTDYATDILPQYATWRKHLARDRPVPKRCLGVKALRTYGYLADSISEPGGKCDRFSAYLANGTSSYTWDLEIYTSYSLGRSGTTTWASALGAAAVLPLNNVMTLTDDIREHTMVVDGATDYTLSDVVKLEPVLSETYIFLNEAPVTLCTPEGDDAFCARVAPTATACQSIAALDNCSGSRTTRCNCAGTHPAGAVETEPNDYPGAATPLTLGTPMWMHSVSTGESGNVDWFSVSIPAGRTLAFFPTAASGAAACSLYGGTGATTPANMLATNTAPNYYTNGGATAAPFYFMSACSDWNSLTAMVNPIVNVASVTVTGGTGIVTIASAQSTATLVALSADAWEDYDALGWYSIVFPPRAVLIPAGALSVTFAVGYSTAQPNAAGWYGPFTSFVHAVVPGGIGATSSMLTIY